ncbi:MAG: TetR family transcriptional regulator, partial [Microbacterium sp.]|nr:TetR family transcriptional regulator [Microbacterium sp.]
MDSRAGRPKSSSRETIADAACELFLEQGYEHTSIADIATRAGVSR